MSRHSNQSYQCPARRRIAEDMQQVVMMQCANNLVLVWPESYTADTEDDADIVQDAVANCPTRVVVYVPGIDNPQVCVLSKQPNGNRRRVCHRKYTLLLRCRWNWAANGGFWCHTCPTLHMPPTPLPWRCSCHAEGLSLPCTWRAIGYLAQ